MDFVDMYELCFENVSPVPSWLLDLVATAQL